MDLRMLFVALVAFAVSAYGGMLAATISHGPAPLPEVRPHPTCDERDVLETERQTALAEGEALVSGLRAEGHAPEPFLGESLEAEHRAALDAVAAPQSLAIFHCGEYPCVAVLKGDQADGIAAALGHAGLTVETVSRVFSRFQKLGVLGVDNKEITIIDIESLRAVADGSDIA
jgi:hypothetical protein